MFENRIHENDDVQEHGWRDWNEGLPLRTLILLASSLPPMTATAVQHVCAITVPTVTYQKSSGLARDKQIKGISGENKLTRGQGSKNTKVEK